MYLYICITWLCHEVCYSVVTGIPHGIYLYTYKTLVVLLACLLEAVRTNPGYGMATLIYNNLLNLILGTVTLLRSNYIIQEKILLYLFK